MPWYEDIVVLGVRQLATGRVIGIATLMLISTSLLGEAQGVRLAQVASVEAGGQAEIGLDLRVRLEPLRIRYQATPYQAARPTDDGALTLRYRHSSFDGAVKLDSSGFQRGRAQATFGLNSLALDGRAKASVNRDGLEGGELEFLLGPPDANLGLTAGFDRIAPAKVDLNASQRLGVDSTLSGAIHVEDGAWTPRVHVDTQLGEVDLTSDWRFDADGVSEHAVQFETPTRPGGSGKLGGTVIVTGEGLVKERLELRDVVAQLPVDMSLSLSGLRLDALALQWTARQPPYCLSSELTLDASGLRRAELDLAVDVAEIDWRAEAAFGPPGLDELELGISSSLGNLTLSSSALFTANGFEQLELEAVMRRPF